MMRVVTFSVIGHAGTTRVEGFHLIGPPLRVDLLEPDGARVLEVVFRCDDHSPLAPPVMVFAAHQITTELREGEHPIGVTEPDSDGMRWVLVSITDQQQTITTVA